MCIHSIYYWVCVHVCVCAHVLSHSVVSDSLLLSCSVVSDSAAPWTVALQVPLSMKFSRQEYWSRFPFPTQGDLPHPRIKPISLTFPVLAGTFLTTEPPGKPQHLLLLMVLKSKLNLNTGTNLLEDFPYWLRW